MQPTDDLSSIQHDILAAYGDLESPSFCFAQERREQQWHAPIVRAIFERFDGEDVTTLDDEVCLSVLVRPRGAKDNRWSVRLSLVGPYALVTRITGRADRWLVSKDDADHDELELMRLVKEGGLRIVASSVLRQPIALRTPSLPPDQVTVYNALFTDFSLFPV